MVIPMAFSTSSKKENLQCLTMSHPRLGLRWIVGLLGFYACALITIQRSSISVSIVQMTSPTKVTEVLFNFSRHSPLRTSELSDECYTEEAKFDRNKTTIESLPVGLGPPEFDWSEELQGVVLGASFYLYCIMPTFAGRLTDALGGKWVTFAGVTCSGLTSLLTPWAISLSGATGLIILQTVMGGALAFIYPSVFSLILRWFPVSEKANANAGMLFGGCVGTSVGSYIAGQLCHSAYGWRAVFYAATLLHVPWMAAWLLLVTNDPADNRWISDAELSYVVEWRKETLQRSKTRKAPYIRIFTSGPVWTSLLTKMGMGFGGFLLLSKTPTYLSTVFGLSIQENGNRNALIATISILGSLVASPVADLVMRHTRLRPIVVRKLFQSISGLGPALCMGLVPSMGCNLTAVTALLLIATVLFQFRTGGEWSTISDFAPNNSGLVLGIASTLSFSTGFMAPLLAGVILNERSSRHEWNVIFYLMTAAYACSSIIFNLFATLTQQDWDKVEDEHNESDDNKGQQPNQFKIKI